MMRVKAAEIGSIDTTGALSCPPTNLYDLVLVPKSTPHLY